MLNFKDAWRSVSKQLKKLAVLRVPILLLAIANPSKADFIDHAGQSIEKKLLDEQIQSVCQGNSQCDAFGGAIKLALKVTANNKAENTIASITRRQNYVLFSVYSVDLYPNTYTFGALGNFWQLNIPDMPKATAYGFSRRHDG